MKKIGWFSRLSNQPLSVDLIQRKAGGIGVVLSLTMTGIAFAQIPAPTAPQPIPYGYTVHQSVDMGGHMDGISGSSAMYDTLVNMQSGPRMLGVTYEMRALPGIKHNLFDSLKAFSNGVGGDPINFAKLNFEKGKLYEFTGTFRRDRQYFDYDLLGNPNIPGGLTIPYGKTAGVATAAALAWPQVRQSPVMFNTVRRMTDTNLTIFPLAKVTFRAGYSQNIFQGPTLSPSYTIAKYDALLQEYQRNSTDDFMGAVDWKPVQGTKLTFEEQINHYKADSYFTLAPSSFIAQEADGTPVSLGNWDSLTPYGIAGCNTASMGTAYTSATTYAILSAPQSAGGLPIINPACAVVTSYMRSQPTRILTPTETLQLQSSSLKNVTMNGDFRYTKANMNLPNFYENVQGLDGAVRSITYKGYAAAHRAVVAADFGIVWQANKTVSISDQVNFSSVKQPGYSNLPIAATLSTPAAPNQTINYSGALIAGNAVALPHGVNGVLTNNFFGQESLTNNLTVSWEATARTTLSLTYRYKNHNIGQGVPHKGDIPLVLADPVNGTVSITENGGIFSVALRPVNHWDVNGSVEVLYDDNAFTPVSPRQTRRYRVHTLYKPRPWATFSGAFNDLERHNNTNNNLATIAAGDTPAEGPLNHVDHTRVVSLGAVLAPNEHYGVDFNYAYSDVYSATNICFDNGAQNAANVVGLPGTASVTSSGAPNLCPGVFTRGSTTQLADWWGRDFMDAPTQYVSAAVTLSPVKPIHSNIGYRISDVSGSRFFNDARDVNGSLVSKYQTPFVNLAWTVHPGWIWKAEYNYYGYGEGGVSGAPLCSTSTSLTSTIVPCNSATLTSPTGLTEPSSGLTAPRNFHANNVTLGLHYEF
jgi:hypothetical protein